MATNNFKPFAAGAGANVTAQADYEALAALVSGFTAGKASSAQVNKALRQSTVLASVLAQFIANTTGKDVLDDGNTATVLTNLIAALKTNGALSFLQTANNFSEIKSAGATAVSAALANLGLSDSGISKLTAFTSSGTFTAKYTGWYKITGTAGGGGGAGAYATAGFSSGGGGAAGGTFVYLQYLETGDTVTVTIGAGGAGATGSAPQATTGGNTYWGTSVYATGGIGGFGTAASCAGGNGGTGKNGIANFLGGYGTDGTISGTTTYLVTGNGGSSFWGGGGRAGISSGIGGQAYGSGGGAAYDINASSASFTGGAGKSGYLQVEFVI